MHYGRRRCGRLNTTRFFIFSLLFFKKDIRIRRIWDGALVNKPREVADSTRGRDEESNKIFWQ